jgi:hydrogenase maturation factor
MRVGKLTSEELKKFVLSKIKNNRREVVLSSSLSEDCAAIKCDDIILLTTDPITSSTSNVGGLALEVSANDISASGGEPFACLFTLIAPPQTTLEEIDKVMSDAAEKAAELNIDIIGGHTEFSDSVVRVIASCTMLGKTKNIIKTTGAKVGHSIIATKTAGIEGTLVLASDFQDRLNLTKEELLEAESYSKKIGVQTEGKICAEFGVASLHDITEGGVFGAVSEMTEADGLGAEIFADKIPVTALTRKICKRLGLNPYRLLSSGSLICTTDRPTELMKKLNEAGVECAEIGKITTGKARAVFPDGTVEFLDVTPDELLKVKRD